MKNQKLSFTDISAVCLELSLFLHAGADTGSALSLLAEATDTPWMKKSFLDMSHAVDQGSSLSKAIKQSQIFHPDVWNMVQVGETTGKTEEALRVLSEYYEQKDTSDHRIRQALLYPSILMAVMLAVIVVLLTKVLPIFNDVYASFGGEMTGIAFGLLQFGMFLDAALPFLCVIFVIALFFMVVFACLQRFRDACFDFFSRKNSKRSVIQKMGIARFAQAFSMGICSGLTTTQALHSASLLFSSKHIEAKRCCDQCIQLLENGHSLSEALYISQIFPATESRLLSLGFASGNAETVSKEIANRLNRDAIESLERRIAIIEPAMVIISSLLIGMILLSVMMPLTQIMTSIG